MSESVSAAFRAWLLHPVTTLLQGIIMNEQELKDALTSAGTAIGDLGTQLTKALGEIQTDIGGLQATIATGLQTTPEVDAAFQALSDKIAAAKAVAQSLDDVVPDAAPAPTPADPAPAPSPADPGTAP